MIFVPKGGNLTTAVILIVIAVALGLLTWWLRRRAAAQQHEATAESAASSESAAESPAAADVSKPAAEPFDPDRGGSGITLTGRGAVHVPPAERLTDAERFDRWLLAFAAPYVHFVGFREWNGMFSGETELLDVWRWDLHRPEASVEDADAARLRVQGADHTLASDRRERAALALSSERAEVRAAALALVAWGYRLDVATGRMPEDLARELTRNAVDEARRPGGEWMAFGDLFTEGTADQRISVRPLYRPGEAWADPQWPVLA